MTRIDEKLSNIVLSVRNMRSEYAFVVKEKLWCYKQLLKSQNDTVVNSTIEWIDTQDFYYTQLKEVILANDYRRDVDLSGHNKFLFDKIVEGEKLLSTLKMYLHAQKSALQSNNFTLYRRYFKLELAEYKKYRKLAKEVPKAIIKEINEDMIDEETTVSNTTIVVILLGNIVYLYVMQFISEEMFEILYENLEIVAIQMASSVGGLFAISKLVRALKRKDLHKKFSDD